MALNYLALDLMMQEDHIHYFERRNERQLLRIIEDPFDLIDQETR